MEYLTIVHTDFSANIWAGYLGNKLLGPYILQKCFNGIMYYAVFHTQSRFLNHVTATLRQIICFMHDGAQGHFQWW